MFTGSRYVTLILWDSPLSGHTNSPYTGIYTIMGWVLQGTATMNVSGTNFGYTGCKVTFSIYSCHCWVYFSFPIYNSVTIRLTGKQNYLLLGSYNQSWGLQELSGIYNGIHHKVSIYMCMLDLFLI